MSSRGAIVIAAIAVVVVVAVVAALAWKSREVIDERSGLLPYTTSKVKEIEVFGGATIYLDQETSRPDPDVVNAIVLISFGAVSLVIGLILRALRGILDRPARFYCWASAGLAYLGLDELLGGHETLGHNLRFLTHLPGVEAPDDFLVLIYGLAGLVFLFYWRDVLSSSTTAMRFLGVGIAFMGLSVASDVVFELSIEDALEIMSAISIVAGLGVLAGSHLSAAIDSVRMQAP